MITEDDDTTIRDLLKREGFSSARQIIAEYECDREIADGTELQTIRVRVTDAGPSNPRTRYHWQVIKVWADGRREEVWANAGDSIYRAGMNVHWRTLVARGSETA
jgi:hypothetical protein